MKKMFTTLFLKREWLLYVLSFAVSFVFTVLIFLVLNGGYDKKLRSQLLESESTLAKKQIELTFKYHHLNNDASWSQDIDKNNEAFLSMWNSFADSASKTKYTSSLGYLMLYNDQTITDYSQAREGLLFPYIKSPNISLNDVMNELDFSKLQKYFGDEGVDNVKRFFSLEL